MGQNWQQKRNKLRKDTGKNTMKREIQSGDMPEEKRHNKKKIITRVILSFLFILLATFLIVYWFAVSKLNKLDRPSDAFASNPIEVAPSYTEQKENDLQDEISDAGAEDAEDQAMQEEIAKLKEMEAIAATGNVFSDSDVFNILLIGTDERTAEFNTNARGDACLLLSLNKASGTMHLVSFERGIGVPILEGEYKGQYDWLTHTFRYGGANLMMEEIQECFKVDVTHYIRVNFNTFVDGINALGGVNVALTQAEADYINKAESEKNHIQHVSVGENHLNGATALYYARCRKIDSDWFRIGRQRTVIQAALDQVSDLSLREINDLLDTILPLIQTNLTNGEIFSLVLNMPQFLGKKTEQATIPLANTYGSMKGMGGRSLYSVDFEANAKALQEMLYGAQMQ